MFSIMKKKEMLIIRRGSAVLGKVSDRNITRLIQAGKLYGSDRISKDAKSWSRLDQISRYRRQLAAVEQARVPRTTQYNPIP